MGIAMDLIRSWEDGNSQPDNPQVECFGNSFRVHIQRHSGAKSLSGFHGTLRLPGEFEKDEAAEIQMIPPPVPFPRQSEVFEQA